MPVTDQNWEAIPLANEMTDRDFNSIKCNWLYGNFESGYDYPALSSTDSYRVAAFLNEQARGPYYVHESHNQGSGAQGKIMNVILLHPDDRADFARVFTGDFWGEEPKGADRNAQVLYWQSSQGFQYENEAMAQLVTELEKQTLPYEWQAADVDIIARRLWAAPRKPGLGVVEVKRLAR